MGENKPQTGPNIGFLLFLLDSGREEPLFVFSALNSKDVTQHSVQRKLVQRKENSRQNGHRTVGRKPSRFEPLVWQSPSRLKFGVSVLPI